MNHFFGWVCGQNPEHTWAPGGLWLPCCERCTGLYVGAVAGLLLHWWCRPKLTAPFLCVHVLFFLGMVPCALDWVPQTPSVRAGSGVLYGFAVVALLRTALNQRAAASPDGAWGYGAGLLGTLVALPWVAEGGGTLVASLLSTVAFLGIVSLGVQSLAVVGACVRGANGVRPDLF